MDCRGRPALLDYWQLEVLPLVLFCIRKNSLVSNFYAGRAGYLSGTRRTCQNPLPRNDVPGFAFSSKQGTLAQFFHVPCFSFSLYSFRPFFYSYLVGLFPYFGWVWGLKCYKKLALRGKCTNVQNYSRLADIKICFYIMIKIC